MKEYLDLSHTLAKKQMQEKIALELVYEFLILDNKTMDIIKIEDVNIFTDQEYMDLVDNAIKSINTKTNLNLVRKGKKIILGKRRELCIQIITKIQIEDLLCHFC